MLIIALTVILDVRMGTWVPVLSNASYYGVGAAATSDGSGVILMGGDVAVEVGPEGAPVGVALICTPQHPTAAPHTVSSMYASIVPLPHYKGVKHTLHQ
jgi:hypothetical protein